MPEIPKPSAASPATPTSSPLAPFRFSLLTLLSVTTLAGFTSAVVFSKGWHPLERLLMAFWCAGLILGMSISRARGKHGIFSAGLGAALGCLLAVYVLHTGDYAVVLTFVIVVGWLLAVGVAALYHALLTGLIETCWRQRPIRRTIYALGGVVIAGLIAWQVGQLPVWKPTWKQHVGTAEIVLSPQGDRLIEKVTSSDFFSGAEEILTDKIHELTPRGLVPVPFSLPWDSDATFAPDGTQIALGRGRQYQLYDARSGTIIWEKTLELNSLEVVLHHRFSRDGKQLYVTTHTPRIQRLHVFDIGGDVLATAELFPFAGHLYVSDGGDKLVKFHDPTDENNEHAVEIVDLASRETICRLNDIAQIEKPIFSLAGDRLALGSRVWELPSSQSRPAGGQVLGLLTNGRVLVLDRDFPDRWRNFLPSWLQQMPFVHHLVSRDRLSQLRISDKTGQPILASPWLEDVQQVELSANQRVAVSASRAGLIRIWKVPE